MTLSTTTNKVSYSGTGSQDTFAYTYKIFSSSDIKVYIRDNSGTETLKTETTHYTVSNVGNASGGNIVFTTGNTPLSTDTVIIVRTVPLTQTFDYVLNDPFPSDSHEDGLDKLTMQVQQVKEEVDRSIKASVTNTINSTEFTQSSTDRANKLFGFDSAGNISITTNVGTNRGDWAASTAYNERDLVKDTSTNNVFQVNTAHTSSGSQPLTSNANSSKYDLLVDAASATSSAAAAATSATAAAGSATTAQGHSNTASGHKDTATTKANEASASASTAAGHVSTASGHATTASNHKTTSQRFATHTGSTVTDANTGSDTGLYSAKHYADLAETKLDNFDDIYLGSKSSAPTVDNDGDALTTGALYWNSSNNNLYVWNGSAWVIGAFSSGGFLATGNNLSDVANAGTARTNLGLGTASTLNVGTSANNIPQLDGNAKLPAVDGSQLTGLASGGTINMTIGSGSSAVSAGTTLTRETNGEAKKVEVSTTTTNNTFAGTSIATSVSAISDRTSRTVNASDMGASCDGRYLMAFNTSKTSNGQYNYWYLQSFVHDGNGNITAGTPTQVSSYAEFGSYGHNRRLGNFRVEYIKECNADAGGTFTVVSGYSAGYGQYGMQRILYFITVDNSGAITVVSNTNIGSAMLTQEDSTYNQSGGFCSFDYGIHSASGNTFKLIAHGCWARTIDYVGYFSKTHLVEWTVTWTGSGYTLTKTRGRHQTGENPTAMSGNYHGEMMIVPDSGSDGHVSVLTMGSAGSTFSSGNMYMNRYTYSSTDTFQRNLNTQIVPGIANTDGRKFRAIHGKFCGFMAMGFNMSGTSSNLAIRTVRYNGAITTDVQGFVSGSSDAPNGKYDYLNNELVTTGDTASRKGQNNHISSYPISTTDNGSSITIGTATNHNNSSNFNPSGTNSYKHHFALGFAGASVSLIGETDITGAYSQKGRYWVYATGSGNEASFSGFKAGIMKLTTNVTATNKSKFFGFAQESGSAGSSIKVMPNDTEGLETNVSGLTHGTTYYVADNGTLTTSAGTDNPLAGQAIGTTALRLPTKSVASAVGAGALADTSRVFCGAVDFRRDSGVADSVIISLPASVNRADVRGYHMYGVGVGFSADARLRIKPYHNGSTIMTGNTVRTANFVAYSGSATSNETHDWSDYLQFGMVGNNLYVGSQQPIQTYNAGDYSPRLAFDIHWENNFKNLGYRYQATQRHGSTNNYMMTDMGVGGNANSFTNSDYISQFYIYPSSGTFVEGIISVYAIVKG